MRQFPWSSKDTIIGIPELSFNLANMLNPKPMTSLLSSSHALSKDASTSIGYDLCN